jgi:2-polyprenyl-3-methyl-5-hydroxy-6-metoxy-1,4-benzoquinol methylase
MEAKTDIYNDGAYAAKNETWHIEDSPWKAAQIQKMLHKNGIQPQKVAEIGCGVGEILNLLSQQYTKTQFSGYEISETAFERAQVRQHERLNFYCEDLIAPENTAFFDVLMVIDVIEHVEDMYGFVRKCREKATHKVFHIPLDISVQTVLRGHPIQKARRKLGHIHSFYKDSALATLKDMGYTVTDHFYTNSAFDLKRNWRTRVANIPRRLVWWFSPDLAVRTFGGFSLMVLAK